MDKFERKLCGIHTHAVLGSMKMSEDEKIEVTYINSHFILQLRRNHVRS